MRPPRPARRERGVRPGVGFPVRRGSDRRLLSRARGPSLKTAEIADKGPAARAGRTEVPGVPDELARLLAEEKGEGADEGARKVKEDRGDVDEEAW